MMRAATLTCLLLLTTWTSVGEPANVKKLRDDRQRLITLVLGLEAEFSATIKDYRALQADYKKLLNQPVIPDQRQEVIILKKKLAHAAAKLREMQRLEAATKKSSAATLAALKNDLNADLASLRAELAQDKNSLQAARAQMEELRIIQIETRRVEEMLRREIIDRAALQSELQSMRGERDALLARLKESMSNLAQANEGRKKAEARVAQLEKSSAALQADLKKRATEITALQKEVGVNKKLKATIAQLEKDKSKVSENLTKNEAELARLKADLRAKDEMLATMDALKKELGTSKTTLASRDAELKKLQADFAEKSKLAATASDLEKEKATLAEKLSEKDEMLKKTKADLAEKSKLAATAAQLEKEKAALAGKLVESGNMLTKAKDDLVIKEKEAAQAMTFKKEKEALSATLAARAAEAEEFRAETAKRLEEIFAENELELERLTKEQSAKTDEANARIAALEKDKTKLQNELSKRDGDLKKAKAAAADRSKIAAAVAAIEKEKAALTNKLSERDAELKKVRTDLGKLHLKSEATAKQMQALKVRFATVAPVRYALGAADVRDQQERVLRDVKEVLAMFPKARFEIVGHTCDLGSKDGNLKLSKERAGSLATFLSEKGVSPDLLKSRGVADAEPLVPNTNEANRRRNRRVEIHILD